MSFNSTAQIENPRIIIDPLNAMTMDNLQPGDSVSVSAMFKVRNLFEVNEVEVLLDSTQQAASPQFSFVFDLKNQQSLPQNTDLRRVGNNIFIDIGSYPYSPNNCVFIKTFDDSSSPIDSLNTCL
jgi:hypothetical protein